MTVERLVDQLLARIEQQVFLRSQFPDYVSSHDARVNYKNDFIKRLELFGTTEKGEKLRITNWVHEFASLVGDLRCYHILTAGNAQCGKSLINTAFMVDYLIFVKLNCIWFYPSKHQVDTLVPELQIKVAKSYIANIEEYFKNQGQYIELVQPGDRQLASRFQVNNATAIFSYASNSGKSATPTKSGLATVGTAGSSFSGSLLLIDERSQIPLESVATLPRRLDAARIPPCIREIGTYGDGIGIEYTIAQSEYHFYPHVTCDHCKKEIALDPKGCLLKKSRITGKFLSKTGRPIEWFYKDPENKLDTAFIGCSHCGTEIPKNKRINAFFKCLRTGVKLVDFLASIPPDYHNHRKVVTIQLSPLLRDTSYNLAEHLITTGLNTESTKDYQQQVLGCTSENAENKISIDMIKDSHWVKMPNSPPTFTLAGIDQGRGEHYIYICQYWLPPFKKPYNPAAIIERTFRKPIYIKPIGHYQIPKILKQYNVDFGFIDNEPDRMLAKELTEMTVLMSADQRAYIPQVQKLSVVETGGIDLETVLIDNRFFLDMVFNCFNNGLINTDWDVKDKGIHSPTRHFTAMFRQDDGRWIRAKDHIDDFYFAAMFCESAFYYMLDQKLQSINGENIDWYNKISKWM